MTVQTSDSLTIRSAIINLCNTCIGIGILAKPFALAVTGWIGIIVLFAAATLVTYAGVCLAFASRDLLMQNKSIMISKPNNYNSTDNNINNDIQISKIKSIKREKSAYQLVSERSMGKKGEIYAIIGFGILVWIILSSVIIMIFELLQQIISMQLTTIYIDPRLIFLIAFIIYIPTALVLNWKQMTFISWIGIISVVSILFTLIALLIVSLYQFNMGPPPKQLLIKNIENNQDIVDIKSTNLAINARKNMTIIEQFAFSLIIFMSGIGGNAAVPKIGLSLVNKNDIIWVVTLSYIMVSIFYCFIACIGYWIYGEYTEVNIINNFFLWPNGKIIIIVSILVICNLWASFSIMLSLIGDVIDSLLNVQLNQFGYRRLLRFILLLFVFAFSFFLRYHLAFLVSLGGIVGVLCSLALTLPLIIYLATFWNHKIKPLSNCSKIFHVSLLAFCMFMGIIAAYIDFENVL